MTKSPSLYADSYCKVLKGELVLKCFFFPTGQAKKLRIEDIQGIYYDDQKFSKQIGMAKSWGMSLSPIWWACDMKR
jgi:hypothetical protein